MRLFSARTPAALALWTISLVAIGGCVSMRTTGAATVEDFRAEDRYRAVYAEQMTEVAADIQLLAPTDSSPGVCNIGGTKQACFDADVRLIQSLEAMRRALEATPVPQRFIAADKLLRDALAENARGLELRNQAIAESDDAIWKEHAAVLGKAIGLFQQAYQAFPEDNRPQPAP